MPWILLIACLLPLALPARSAWLFDDGPPPVRKPQPKIDDDDLPNPHEDLTRAGDWAISTWGAPALRFTSNPPVEFMAGGGIDFLYRPLDALGCFVGASLWAGRVEVDDGDPATGNATRHVEIDVVEVITGARMYAHRWGSGAIYWDLRLAYMVTDGPDPVLRTQSWGADIYFGIEVGEKPAYFFIEGGIGIRAALFRDGQGWVGTGRSRDANSGDFVDFTRLGLRIYF